MAEKRAVGYKDDAQARVLARFEAFSRREFPGSDTLTEASVTAWITAAHRRDVKPATLQGLAAPVRELARRGTPASEIYARASTEAKRRALEAVYTDVVTADLTEWNQNPELLDWLANL